MRLGPHTITVRRAGSKASSYGNRTELDWSPGEVTDTVVTGCSVEPAPMPENTLDRDSVGVRQVVRAPLTTDVTALDRVVYDGDVYDVDGEPERWKFHPLGHIVITIRRSTG